MPMTRAEQASGFRTAGKKAEAAQDVVFGWLKRRVVALPRNAGTFLTEGEVCRATGVSRTPVREAFLRLEADGFLQIVPKKGAYVPPITESDVEAIMQARGLVEDFCVRAAARLGGDLASELERRIAKQEKLRSGALAFIESDRDFHRVIVRAARNPVLADFYESLRDRQVRMGIHAIATSEQRSANVLAEHSAIVAGVRSGDPDQAAAAMRDHLDRTLAALHSPILSNWPNRP
jgi:DNA-binding GntR family transcriptional regulator